MKCSSNTSLCRDVTEKNQVIIKFFNAYLYFFGKYKQPVAFASSEQETITVKPMHISHSSPLLHEKRHQVVESNGVECLAKLDVIVNVFLGCFNTSR